MDGTIAPAGPEGWGLARRLGFRFASCYLAFSLVALELRPASQTAFGQPEDSATPLFELELVWNDAELIAAQLEERTLLLETRGFHSR